MAILQTPIHHTRRLRCYQAALALFMVACAGVLAATPHSEPKELSKLKTLLLGDSLSAGYGIEEAQSWVSLARSDRRLKDTQIINASISGETSGGGLSRLDALLAKHQPDIVAIELGVNDGLRGHPLQTIEHNLEQLTLKSKRSGAQVLLLGMRLPPNYGRRYAEGFEMIYSKLAAKHQTALVQFILAGVGSKPELMRAGGSHPTAEAQPQILENIAAPLAALVATVKAAKEQQATSSNAPSGKRRGRHIEAPASGQHQRTTKTVR